MKPTSIIFLIISVVLVIGGFATAGVAKQFAASEGIDLSVTADENSQSATFRYEYGNDTVEKITVSVKNADVNIIGGSDKPYVELINFTEGMYSFSSGNRVIEIKDGMDFTSVSGIMSVVGTFRGLRSFVNYYYMKDFQKTVNIYICDANPINKVEVLLDAGQVSISDITAAADYSVKLDAGNVNMKNINTTSFVKVSVDAGQIDIDECVIKDCELDVDIGSISINAKTERLDADIDVGDFNLEYTDSLEAVNLNLYAIVGTITLDGEKISGYMETDRDGLPNVIDVSVSTGNIVIDSNS